MRVVLAVERFDRASGGQAVWARGFAEFLRDRGHEVHVVANHADGEVPGVRCHLVPRYWSPLRRAQAFDAAIAALRADVLHDSAVASGKGVFHPQAGSNLHSLDAQLAAEPARRRLRAACSPKMLLLRAGMRRLERRQARSAARIVAVSSLVARLLRAQHPAAAGKIVVVPNGVDTRHFVPPERKPIPGAALTVAVVAHNPALKGLDVALRAVARLRAAGHPLRLTVAGTPADERWRALARELGLADHVQYTGYVTDMRSFYQRADVLVHATRWDACSLATLEAMACGLPVVTTARNGAAELIAHGRSGLVIADDGGPAACAAALTQLVDPGLRAAIGAAAREAVLARDIAANFAGVEAVLAAAAR